MMLARSVIATVFFLGCVQLAVCQENAKVEMAYAKINKGLESGQKTVSDILSDTEFMFMHSWTNFRQVIAQHAKAEKITIITDHEPGVKITVKGMITGAEGKPVNDALVYI